MGACKARGQYCIDFGRYFARGMREGASGRSSKDMSGEARGVEI